MTKFIHLHTHSHYSLLNALPKIPELIEAAVKDEMPALALTDNGNLYGAIEFYQKCQKAGIKPIIGIDAYVAPRTRFDKENRIDNRWSRLVLLAENGAGYKNLIKLVTDSHLEGFYYKPRVDRELLEKYKDGLIAILPSFASEISRALKDSEQERAQEALAWYQKNYGKENLFAEITHHPEVDGHEELMQKIRALYEENGIPLVAAHDTYYLKPEDRLARETMVRIQSNAGTPTDRNEDFSFITQKEACKRFKGDEKLLARTLEIAERCNVEIEMKWQFPNYIIESRRTPDEELRHHACEGVTRRSLSLADPVIKERLEYELEVIKQKGYATYFLVVGDLLREAHERGILTTIRGSVAGSLTTYVLGITNVNPIEYKLPFERFLNPERPSAPDIDMDFADNRRDEIIQYAREKYGEDKVAQIGTFGTMMARGSVRDVARALGHAYGLGDRIAKMIPFGSQGFPMTISKALEMVPELKQAYRADDEVKEVLDLAMKIEGCARHIGVHAAGVVISPTPLTDYVPLQYDPKGGKLVTQYNMHSVGEDGVGLLKFDFLGITNLAILADAVERVEAIQGIAVDIENIPLDDTKTFEMLARGETMGLFQLNGSGMTHFLKELKPSSIHDINAMVALYRPGPMDVIPEYIARKNNPALVNYPDPRMEPYLQESYGLIVYQDDLLFSAIELAGYTWLEADKFRKAVGKKIPEEMAAQKEKFIEGVIEHGRDKTFAEKMWKLFEPFQAYGFNKAHAASYGKVAYQTAYMKANFPLEYMSAVLTADGGDVDKIAEGISECTRMGIEVLPPDVNESFGDFSVVPNAKSPTIRFGLYSIKNFGTGIADSIIAERKKNGKFTSLANFLERVHDKNINRKSLESLIKSGALDHFGERGVMLAGIERALSYAREFAQQPDNQDSLFGSLPETGVESNLELPKVEPISMREQLAWERELLGLYVSGHPLDEHKEKLNRLKADIKKTKESVREGVETVIGGIVEDSKVILTKSGEQMAFLRIADFSDTLEVVIFPRLFTAHKDLFALEKCIAIKGRLSNRNGEQSMVAEAVKAL
ncbi:DNA polymerase III subunit alpha [Candidatus Kaiserbacteria bacterium CG10_big_fil_rev_8_21_14_0_10_49_17]|uniref:DNA polymerase III subunit alpha n=1 Tax=Candidatus Kaiserbacteria bacterium CG10_big_fil_rev_8_21_14_0_10_49_17 TaxID=1974609 RepID=A0A2M6WF15_9BACT|nr:MAG: DNA polymerase III subunit alpha [Candidatus Kaiserbacteria bacterium CG10_big_fil_rev_8_21_14_0_10_49_17]